EALEQGLPDPTEQDCVQYGLLRAARLDPLEVREEEVPGLIRQALYESIPVDALPNSSSNGRTHDPRDAVIERSLEALERHLGDKTKFDAWFSGPKNSFVRQVAQQKQAPGGQMERDLVRRVLQDLGWDAYRYVGDCL